MRRRYEERERRNRENMREVPEEIEFYKDCMISDPDKIKEIEPLYLGKLTVGNVEIDEDEKAALKLHPNFSVMRELDSEEMETDTEVSLGKLRYEIRKQKERKELGNVEFEVSEGKRRKIEAEPKSEKERGKMEIGDVKERRIFDPMDKVFNFSKRRVTDLKENSKVYLPKPATGKEEGEMEMIREMVMSEFNNYKKEL